MGRIVWDRRWESPQQQGLGLAKLRLDGFVSIDAGPDEGVLTTSPLAFEGRQLVVNATAAGYLDVEVLDPEGQSLEGYEVRVCDSFRGDDVRHVATWNGKADLALLGGRPIRLRFRLKDAKLYSFGFQN